MLRNLEDLQGSRVEATDGAIGHVKDFYFDDDAWVVRYLVVDAGSWLSSRKVLISPISIGQGGRAAKSLPVSITKEQVRNSPEIDTEKPVSRQHETRYLGYYGYPLYWGGGGLWGAGLYPNLMLPGYAGFGSVDTGRAETENARTRIDEAAQREHEHDDPHLRSCNEVVGYHIDVSDGDIGHVEGFLVDDETWAVRYLVVDTSNWWGGHKVLIAPQWIRDVDWADAKVAVDLTRQAVKDAPPYDPSAALDREHEQRLYEHHGRPGYWTDAPKQETDIDRT